MITNLIHFVVALIVAYCIFYAVQYSETDDEEELTSEITNTTKTILESDVDVKIVIPQEDLQNTIIKNRFVVGEVISIGHVGIVRNGVDQETGSEIAIKFSLEGEEAELLMIEYENYLLLGADDPGVLAFGIPNVLHFGEHGGYRVLVLKLLGPTIQELKEVTERNKLIGKTILKIALQVLDTLNYIHSKDLIAYDIKASNMAVGSSKDTLHKVFMFDFVTAVPISHEYLPKQDLFLFGLILLDLNGVKFENKVNGVELEGNSYIVDSLLKKWDKGYAKKLFEQSDKPEIFQEYFQYLINLKNDESIDYNTLKDIFAGGLTIEDLDRKSLGIFDSS